MASIFSYKSSLVYNDIMDYNFLELWLQETKTVNFQIQYCKTLNTFEQPSLTVKHMDVLSPACNLLTVHMWIKV